MSVVVNAALAGPKTSRYGNVYGALSNNGVLPNYGRTDMLGSGSSALSRLTTLIDSLGGILWLPNQHNYTLTTDTAVAPLGDPVGYMGSHRQNLPENYVKNSMMVGATSSTLPTWWTTVLAANGVTATQTGAGTDADGTYLEFTFSGTAGETTGFIYIYNNGNPSSGRHPVAFAGQLWSGSCKVKSVSGGIAIIGMSVSGYTSTAWAEGTLTGYSLVNGEVKNVYTTYKLSNVLSVSAATYLSIRIPANSGTWDQVIRIYAPQLERGKPTAFTPTYGEAITRGTNFEPAWQDTTANKPILGVDADGKSILTFDGTDDFFRTGIQTPEAGYVAGVWQTSSTGVTKAMFSSCNSLSITGVRLVQGANNTIFLQRSDGTTLTGANSAVAMGTNKKVIDGHYAIASAAVRQNGGDEGTNAVSRTPTSANYFRIGADGAGGDTQANYWPGPMLAQVWIPGARPGATIEAEIRRLLAEITAVSGVV